MQAKAPDSKLYHLNHEQVELIVEALGDHACMNVEHGYGNYQRIVNETNRLIDYLQSGGEAP